MLAPLRGGVNVGERQPGLIREVPLEQPMRAHDLQRRPLAIRRQAELLSLRFDEALSLHPPEQGDDGAIGQPKGPADRDDRGAAAPVLLIEQVFKGIFQLPPLPGRTSARPPEEVGGNGKNGKNQPGHPGHTGVFDYSKTRLIIGRYPSFRQERGATRTLVAAREPMEASAPSWSRTTTASDTESRDSMTTSLPGTSPRCSTKRRNSASWSMT